MKKWDVRVVCKYGERTFDIHAETIDLAARNAMVKKKEIEEIIAIVLHEEPTLADDEFRL